MTVVKEPTTIMLRVDRTYAEHLRRLADATGVSVVAFTRMMARKVIAEQQADSTIPKALRIPTP